MKKKRQSFRKKKEKHYLRLLNVCSLQVAFLKKKKKEARKNA